LIQKKEIFVFISPLILRFKMDIVILSALILVIFTFIGSLFTLLFKSLSTNTLGYSLSFSGGVMFTASFTSLLLPSLSFNRPALSIIGLVCGAVTLYIFEKLIPHLRFLDIKDDVEKGIFLIVSMVILHNIPEGLAVGISLENDLEMGFKTSIAIGIQDIPEGFVVSLPLIYITGKKLIPIFIGFLSGVSEAVFLIIGIEIISIYKTLLPFGLSFSAGAMLMVVAKDIVPIIFNSGNRYKIAVSFILGLLIMLILDNIKL